MSSPLRPLLFCLLLLICFCADLGQARVTRPNHRYYRRNPEDVPTACVIIITRNEWPLIRSSVLHHGDLFGFENVHVIDNSDDPIVIDYLEKAASKYDVSVTFSTVGLGDLGDEITTAMLSKRHLCDFFFKLDTDEFLAVHDEATKSVLVDKSTFLRSLQKLPVDGQKYEISQRMEVMVQDTCEDPTLATNFYPLDRSGHMSKFFFLSKSLLMIDLGSHNGRIDPAINQTYAHPSDIMILHFHNKCHDTYIRNMKEALASQGIFSLSDTPEKLKVALEPYKDKFLNGCNVLNCHKMADLYSYLNDPVGHSKRYKKLSSDPMKGVTTITGLREKVLALSSLELMP